MFMELSRFLFNGNAELHLANFLHMITTMTESGGSTEEQIETFIFNSQKVPKLPDDEPIWPTQPIGMIAWSVEQSPAMHITKRIMKPSTSSGSNRNWPPASWKTAPKFISSSTNDVKMQEVAKQIDHKSCSIEDHVLSIDLFDNLGSSNDVGHGGTNMDECNNVKPGTVDQDDASSFSQKDQLSNGTADVQQAFLTGRLGEELAFKHYRKLGNKLVEWVNETKETGLPYDLEVSDEETRKKEYIEVKTTDSSSKDWFEISVREWQFAVEEGESFSIARVILSGEKTAQVTVFKNPVKLCQLGQLKLAVLMSKQQG